MRARLLAAYGSSACVVDERDRLWCWGVAPINGGQLETSPTLVTTAPGAVELALFGAAYCVRTDAGAVLCGGANDVGQLGDESPARAELRAVPGLPAAESLVSSSRGFCALSREDELWCWGFTNQRDPTSATMGLRTARYGATRIGAERFERVVGSGAVCVSSAGPAPRRTLCENSRDVDSSVLSLVEMRALPPWPLSYVRNQTVCVSSFGQAACNMVGATSGAFARTLGVSDSARLVHFDLASRPDRPEYCTIDRGELRCSATSATGRIPLLLGSSDDRGLRRVDVAAVSEVAISHDFGCAIESNGAVVCWGSDQLGQLGQRRQRVSQRPLRVSGLSGVRDLSIIGGRTERTLSVLFTNERGLFARQNNAEDELEPETGPRSAPFSNSFVDEIAPAPAPSTPITSGSTVCALFDGGRLRCSPSVGQWTEPFGASSEGTRSFALGWQAFCRLTITGRVECISHPTSSDRPRTVPELANARAIASGHERVCAITDERTVRCVVRRLVDSRGTIDMRVETLEGVDDAEALFVSGRATCVTRSDGSLWCTGDGWLAGRPVDQALSTLTRIDGVRDVRSMGLSAPSFGRPSLGRACALDARGAVYCWGDNTFRECAVAGAPVVERPTRVEGLAPATSVVHGFSQTCAVLRSSEVWCWGLTTASTSGGIGSIYVIPRPMRVTLPPG